MPLLAPSEKISKKFEKLSKKGLTKGKRRDIICKLPQKRQKKAYRKGRAGHGGWKDFQKIARFFKKLSKNLLTSENECGIIEKSAREKKRRQTVIEN